jgi:signal peptidase II
MAVSLAGDLASKHYAFKVLMDDPALSHRVEALRAQHGPALIPERVLAELHLHRQVAPGVQFTLSINPGVVFGTPMPWPVVAAATTVAVVAVMVFFAVSPARARWTHAALALITAGAMGNLYDRLVVQTVLPGLEPIRHHVRDFIDCSQIGYKWIFNLADAYLVIGVAMLVLHWLLDGRKAAKARAAR